MKLTREQAAVKLDFDNVREPPLLEIQRLLRRAGYIANVTMIGESPSGRGWHVVLYLSPRPTSPYEVVALEAILGGDVNRAAMQLHRARVFPKAKRFMRDAWNVLYAPHPRRIRHLPMECIVHE